MNGAVLRALALVPCAAAYGFALGSAHSWLYAVRNLVKLPLLIGVTATVCALASWLLARALGAPLSLRAVQRAVLATYGDLALLLASLAPAAAFLGLVLRATDDGRLGEYYLFLGANLLVVGSAGTVALVRRAAALRAETGLAPVAAARVTLAWLALALFVGGQASFWLRPFFGLPATRGGTPPFCLGSTPDVRGATNFYEMVLLILRNAPLEK